MFILENKTDGSYFGAKSFYIKSEFSTEAAAKAAKTRYTKKYADVFDADNSLLLLADYVEHQITRTKSFPVQVKQGLIQLVLTALVLVLTLLQKLIGVCNGRYYFSHL